MLIEVEDVNGLTGIGEADSSSAAVHAVVTMQDEHRWNWGLRSVHLGADPVQVGALCDKLAEVTAYQRPSGISRHALAAVDIAVEALESLGGTPRTSRSLVVLRGAHSVRTQQERTLARPGDCVPLGRVYLVGQR